MAVQSFVYRIASYLHGKLFSRTYQKICKACYGAYNDYVRHIIAGRV